MMSHDKLATCMQAIKAHKFQQPFDKVVMESIECELSGTPCKHTGRRGVDFSTFATTETQTVWFGEGRERLCVG